MSGPGVGDSIGPYRLEEVVAVGGMGLVHLATDTRLGRRVALKIVLGQHASSPEYAARFQREAAVMARLDSPHVVAIFDHGLHDGQPYIAMQYAAGGDLGTLLRRRGPMPVVLAARVCAQVADALVAAHAVGVVHRDVKPANVLLRDDRIDRVHVYLSDFGVALTEATGLTSPGAVAGTWNYLSPERVDGRPASASSDVYSVGCLLHELLTGRPPYDGSDVEVAMQHLSAPVPSLPDGDRDGGARGVNRVLARSLAKDPAHRYPSAAALRDDLRELAGTLTGATPLPGQEPVPDRPRRRRRWVVGGVALVAAAATATAVAITGPGGDAPGDPGPTASTGGPVAPSSPATSPSPPPAPAAAVQGDLDGDGRGDAVWSDVDRSYVARSTATGFADVVRRPVPGAAVMSGDATGDGRADLVRVDGQSQTLVVTVHDDGRDALPSAVVTVPRVVEDADGLSADPDYALADVDGDDLDDLVVATAAGPATTVLTVALNRGDGAFGQARRWYRGPLDPDDAGWAVGDLDADGDDDLLAYVSVDLTLQARVVVSSGDAATGFTVARPVLRVPDEVDDRFVRVDLMTLGDVDGDGAPEVVGLGASSPDAVVWEWLGNGFGPARSWITDETGGGASYAALLDVDADGLADVVLLGEDGLRVHLSSGAAFGYARQWRARFTLPGTARLVDRVSLGLF